MKKKIVSGLLLFMIVLIISSCTERQEEIGVLDMERLLIESRRAAELEEELSLIGDQLERDYDQKKEELSGEAEEEELDRLYQEYLNNKERLEEELNREVREILAEITEEKGLDIVLSSGGVVSGGTDITTEVIERLDEKTALNDAGQENGSAEKGGA